MAVALHQSTLRKVDVMANLFRRALDGQLRTNTTWWEMNGGSFRGVVNWVADNKVIAFLLTLIGLALAVWSLK